MNPAALQPGTMPPPTDGFTYELIKNFVIFDTLAWTTAVTISQTYFVTFQQDPTLGNMPSQGQLPDGWYFDPKSAFIDFLTIPAFAAGAATGPILDIATILNTQRATYEFKYNDKSYGVRPLRSVPALGAVQGIVAAEGASADPGKTKEFGWNGPVGQYTGYLSGLRIAPKTKFSAIVTCAAAPTLSQTPLNIVASLVGDLWRKVT